MVSGTYRDYLPCPHTADAVLNANLQRFADYYSREWLSSQDKIDRWNHFYNDGPRTTNAAEGYNNSLAAKFDERRHPRLAVFLVVFREFHMEKQVRIGQLRRGAALPRPRLPAYVQNDLNITTAKQQFTARLAQLVHNHNNNGNQMEDVVVAYLDRIQNHIG